MVVRLKKLKQSVYSRLCSSQTITSPMSIVKELLENSIDAGSTSIEINYIGAGLQLIRVKDNGKGMSGDDLNFACQAHYTSKLEDYSDLNVCSSYGFRGEALSSICSIGQVFYFQFHLFVRNCGKMI